MKRVDLRNELHPEPGVIAAALVPIGDLLV